MINLFNAEQRLRAWVGLRPKDCCFPKYRVFCDGCEPGNIFECESCRRLVAFCRGGSEDEFCDLCWNERNPLMTPKSGGVRL